MAHGRRDPISRLQPLLQVVILAFALFCLGIAQDVFIPIALAMLLTFVLSPIVERLSGEVRASLKAADAVAKINDDLGLTIVASTPEELAAHLRRDIDAVGSLAKAIGLEPE